MPDCRHPATHTWPPATRNCHFLVQPLSFHPVFKARAQQSLGSVRHTHPPLQCQQDPGQQGTFLICNGKVSERFLSTKCSYFICYSKWSHVAAHSLPTVPSDHKGTEVLFLFHATTNPLIPGTCKHITSLNFKS